MKSHFLGVAQTIWNGSGSFLDEFYVRKLKEDDKHPGHTEANCFKQMFDALKTEAEPTAANGAESSINRGIEAAGWDPPMLKLAEVRTIGLDEFCAKFKSAAKYKEFFIAAGLKYEVNPTLLAAMAMEESHCDPTVSDGGNPANAGGIMQIQGTPEKGSADPATNIMQGAHELRNHIEESKGNVLEAIGSYNGWKRGLVVATMIHPPWGGASMNLDYIHQILNGWCQGIDGYSIGSYNKKHNPKFGEQFK
jgi:hypothetical protein